jgi:hypothetical protein
MSTFSFCFFVYLTQGRIVSYINTIRGINHTYVTWVQSSLCSLMAGELSGCSRGHGNPDGRYTYTPYYMSSFAWWLGVVAKRGGRPGREPHTFYTYLTYELISLTPPPPLSVYKQKTPPPLVSLAISARPRWYMSINKQDESAFISPSVPAPTTPLPTTMPQSPEYHHPPHQISQTLSH